jgi:hypothetical protein
MVWFPTTSNLKNIVKLAFATRDVHRDEQKQKHKDSFNQKPRSNQLSITKDLARKRAQVPKPANDHDGMDLSTGIEKRLAFGENPGMKV